MASFEGKRGLDGGTCSETPAAILVKGPRISTSNQCAAPSGSGAGGTTSRARPASTAAPASGALISSSNATGRFVSCDQCTRTPGFKSQLCRVPGRGPGHAA